MHLVDIGRERRPDFPAALKTGFVDCADGVPNMLFRLGIVASGGTGASIRALVPVETKTSSIAAIAAQARDIGSGGNFPAGRNHEVASRCLRAVQQERIPISTLPPFAC
jgi:hypothetical protein